MSSCCPDPCNNKNEKKNTIPLCRQIQTISPNTYTAKVALSNLDLNERTLCGMKATILDFVNHVNCLYQNLSQDQTPNKYSLTKSFAQFNSFQQSMLKELKVLSEAKISDGTSNVYLNLSDNSRRGVLSSADVPGKENAPTTDYQNFAINYFWDNRENAKSAEYPHGRMFQKVVYSRKVKVKFSDCEVFHLVTIPSFTFNYDKSNDSISVRANYNEEILDTLTYNNNYEKMSYFWINRDSKDGKLYKNSQGVYVPDFNDSHNQNVDVTKHIDDLLEYYESILNYSYVNSTMLIQADGSIEPTGVSIGNTSNPNGGLDNNPGNSLNPGNSNDIPPQRGNDIKTFFDFIDLNINKIRSAKKTICIRANLLN